MEKAKVHYKLWIILIKMRCRHVSSKAEETAHAQTCGSYHLTFLAHLPVAVAKLDFDKRVGRGATCSVK